MRGILITCNMNERKCVGEAYSLLGEYGDLLYGPEQVRAGCPGRDGLSPRPGGGKGLLGGGSGAAFLSLTAPCSALRGCWLPQVKPCVAPWRCGPWRVLSFWRFWPVLTEVGTCFV